METPKVLETENTEEKTNKQTERARALRSDFTSGGSSADFHVAITEKWTGKSPKKKERSSTSGFHLFDT